MENYEFKGSQNLKKLIEESDLFDTSVCNGIVPRNPKKGYPCIDNIPCPFARLNCTNPNLIEFFPDSNAPTLSQQSLLKGYLEEVAKS